MKDPEFRDDDTLDAMLREWTAPDPPPSLDAGVRDAFHSRRPSLWRRAWNFRISIPAPVFAALLLVVAAALWWQTRNPASPAPNNDAGYFTKVENAGFQPLPDGAVRIIRARDNPKGERP